MPGLLEKESVDSSLENMVLSLADDQRTTLHAARYLLSEVQPRIVAFEEETTLLDYCEGRGIQDAIGGGFFLRQASKALGELWINSVKQNTAPFIAPWGGSRGSLYLNGSVAIAPRDQLPAMPDGDLLQAGPILLQNGHLAINDAEDKEGFSAGSFQFDADITVGRYPRAAIGVDNEYLWLVACDGRAPHEAGLTLSELSQAMAKLGINDALNLDGGSSACLVKDGKLLNTPRSDDEEFRRGRGIYNAIVLYPTT